MSDLNQTEKNIEIQKINISTEQDTLDQEPGHSLPPLKAFEELETIKIRPDTPNQVEEIIPNAKKKRARTLLQKLHTVFLIFFIAGIIVTDISVQLIIGTKKFHKFPISGLLFIPLGVLIFVSFWKSVMTRAHKLEDPGLGVARHFYHNMMRIKMIKAKGDVQKNRILDRAMKSEQNDQVLTEYITRETKRFVKKRNEFKGILDTKHRSMFSRNNDPV